MNNKVLDKVQKLIDLAGNNPSQEEAESAMMMAQSLLAKNGLEMSDLPGEKSSVFLGTTERGHGPMPVWWKRVIANTLARNFRCKSYTVKYKGGGSALLFVGLKQDLEVCLWVRELAFRACADQTSLYVARKKQECFFWSKKLAARYRNDFRRGWIGGLDDAFARNVAKMSEEHALVIVESPEVDEWVESQGDVQEGKVSKPVSAGSLDAMMNGRRAGMRFSYKKELEAKDG